MTSSNRFLNSMSIGPVVVRLRCELDQARLIGFEPYEINHEESLLYERILERRVRSILKLVVGEDGFAWFGTKTKSNLTENLDSGSHMHINNETKTKPYTNSHHQAEYIKVLPPIVFPSLPI